MPEVAGPVYEVTHRVDSEILDEFDLWLGGHIETMLELPGIIRASTYAADAGEDGRPRRVTLYYFDSERDLDEYITGPAAAMRQDAEDRFAGQFEVSRRVLRETDVVDGEVRTAEPCLNCGTPLGGQYCGQCGQRAQSRLISIWDLTREAFGDLFELDSRLWRTLIPLVVRPGQLTRDYLEGRRARFMPPFRTYLVLSIVFFLIAFFDPRDSFSFLFEPDAPAEPAAETPVSQSADEIRAQVMDDLVESGVLLPEQAEELQGDETDADATTAEDSGINIRLDDNEVTTAGECDDVDLGDAPDWMQARLTPERLKAVCERVMADDGRTFLSRLLDNVPAALFILLPLMAFVLKLLYPLSKRYYVEHLLFVVHFHAFVFLILTLQVLFSRLAGLLSVTDAIAAITAIAVSLYVPIYFYKSMRRVYEQGHFFTTVKFLGLFFTYTAGLSVIFVGAAIFTAFSI
jgi:hypothetical protein